MVTRWALAAVILLWRWRRRNFETSRLGTEGASSHEKCAVDAAVGREQPAPGAEAKVPIGVGRMGRGGVGSRTLEGGRGGKQKKEMETSRQLHPQRAEADARMTGDDPLKRGSLRLMDVDSVGVCRIVRLANLFGNLFCWR